MFKLANQVIDAHDDVYRELLIKVAKINPKINMMSDTEKGELHDGDFALSVITKKAEKLNKFPIRDHDSTWLSNQYFNETHYRLPKEAAETAAHWIKSSCEYHDIDPTQAVKDMAKTASSNLYYEKELGKDARVHRHQDLDLAKFAEVQKIGDNETVAQYTFNNDESIKLGNQYFDEYCEEMPVEYRHKYAVALQKRASELGSAELKGKIEKYAGCFYGAHVDAHLLKRKDILQSADPKFTSALEKIGSMKNELSPNEFANLLHGFDKRANLIQYYDGHLANPFKSTFSGMTNPKHITKTASAELDADGITKLCSQKYAKIKEYFGVSIADNLKKEGSAAFEALPSDAKEIMLGIADGTL